MILPHRTVLPVCQWCYRGIWGVITTYLSVPKDPPALKGADDQSTRAFRPAEGFLRHLKFYFWFFLLVVDGSLFILWIILLYNAPLWINVLLTPVIWVVMILPDIVAYIAIHLRYDSTWYVLSDRSMRIRRGIWIIHETTITYDNIQNVSVSQGPLQRYFGISDVKVETAGGGGGTPGHGGAGHQGLLEGVDCAAELRELIMVKWQQSKSRGLGDEEPEPEHLRIQAVLGKDHLDLLGEIRDLSVALAKT